MISIAFTFHYTFFFIEYFSAFFCHSLTFSSFFPNMSIYTFSFRCNLHYFPLIFFLSILILSLLIQRYLIVCIFLCCFLQHTFLFRGSHIFFFKIFSSFFICVHFFFLPLRFLQLQTILRIFHSSPPTSSCFLFLFFIDNHTSFTTLFTLSILLSRHLSSFSPLLQSQPFSLALAFSVV